MSWFTKQFDREIKLAQDLEDELNRGADITYEQWAFKYNRSNLMLGMMVRRGYVFNEYIKVFQKKP